MMYRKPVCTHCHLEYKTKKVGIIVVDIAPYGPHRYTYADLLECPRCHHQITWGYGDHPTYHSDPSFHATILRHKHEGTRVDCDG